MAEVCLRGVICRYGEDVTLCFPDLEIPSGEQAVLLGPSGSGKTTLLHLLAGLRGPSAGEVWVDGRNLATLSEAQRDAYRRERVGYLFQDFYLMEGYTALENVLLGLGIAGVRGAAALRQAAEILRAVGLGQRLSHPPKRLSTGERQRVALARAVAHRPRLLLADEPTAHLDRSRAATALDLLTQTAKTLGATLVVATHDPWVMERFPRRLELYPHPATRTA
ncbi:translation initiation factor IF-2 (plasmid) [Allomeiothermus silvanus DSM 9946]|uniref:Translation initiation factor IF-2 n=1 Tax=Allomeiothermus silvanus (strain ATCC 700542 / DSM 9946 / NBRC 106475 / NCIMB 13440 / VI-R2) TaxID=526227 RepID=D7BIW2_ALLS1|nr:ABC transporter ATP-binding protein [Allomeiothermus silvanus]ADH65118.1 translation initiation factor IF-2 [Allomeiothermus silvanus DSM 9946]